MSFGPVHGLALFLSLVLPSQLLSQREDPGLLPILSYPTKEVKEKNSSIANSA
ncbi:Hypothetical protein Minf_0376 [Methylacidiphilum infernorum V4]|uniref:Uncharacterized protein n=1 Tax=Methylacidiphilum infernorum (isolate V4) TaxID=481448 RepID=B3DYR2_METI4|nr:Hypothetical protein Minf_0376 [Methylacidiphilum infernorum V4]